MENLLRRVRVAERVVAKRAKKRSYIQRGKKRTGATGWHNVTVHLTRQQIQAARENRREDWELGELAPRRDVAKPYKKPRYGSTPVYGSVTTEQAGLNTGSFYTLHKQARSAWCGGPRWTCLRPGDRVVVMEGEYQNEITTISKIDRERMLVHCDTIRTNQVLPRHLLGWTKMDPVEPLETSLPMSSVRLVHPLPDPETGIVRDVIIRELRACNKDYDKVTRTVTWDRVVPGLNVVIPWPKEADEPETTHPVDTKWADADEKTYMPRLLSPPMPEAVVDELRNKYSRFRTRFTEEYVAKKEPQEAAKKAARRTVSDMLLPVQEFNRKRREERRAAGQPELSDDMLARIGEVMEKNARLRGKGVVPEKIQDAIAQLSVQDDGPGEQPQP